MIRGNGGTDSVTFTTALNLGAATLTVEAETIAVTANLTAAAVTLTAAGDTHQRDRPAPAARVTVAGTITATGAVTLTATATDTWGLTGQTLTTDTTFAVGATAIAEVAPGTSRRPASRVTRGHQRDLHLAGHRERRHLQHDAPDQRRR